MWSLGCALPAASPQPPSCPVLQPAGSLLPQGFYVCSSRYAIPFPTDTVFPPPPTPVVGPCARFRDHFLRKGFGASLPRQASSSCERLTAPWSFLFQHSSFVTRACMSKKSRSVLVFPPECSFSGRMQLLVLFTIVCPQHLRVHWNMGIVEKRCQERVIDLHEHSWWGAVSNLFILDLLGIFLSTKAITKQYSRVSCFHLFLSVWVGSSLLHPLSQQHTQVVGGTAWAVRLGGSQAGPRDLHLTSTAGLP